MSAGIILLVGHLWGCSEKAPQEPYYNLSIQNAGDLTMKDVFLSFGEYEWALGDLAPIVTKTEVGCMEPVPTSLSLQWRSDEGRKHEKQVRITEPLPRDFQGSITLKVNSNNAVVLSISHKR